MSRSSQRVMAAAIGLVFLLFGAGKALDPAAFAFDIQNYRLLPWPACVLLALYLPWLELFCGVCLILHRAYRGALLLSAAMLALFIAAYSSTRLRGLDVDCGCFGHGVHGFHWPLLIMDPILLATLLWLFKADLRPLSPVIRPPSSPG